MHPPTTTTSTNEPQILTVLESTLYVGFVSSNPENLLVTKVLHKDDAFVFPNQAALILWPSLLSAPRMPFLHADDVLVKAFQVDKNLVIKTQSRFYVDSHYNNLFQLFA
ncbi:germin-like protein 8-7 [Aristolochia californica]|uniref:germin-like protein 8-7 n=1 Tax=Aristolochia californica TaxID=171875 RepID=UPI0035D781E4